MIQKVAVTLSAPRKFALEDSEGRNHDGSLLKSHAANIKRILLDVIIGPLAN